MNKLTNLEIIKKAAKMGYSAVLKWPDGIGHVVAISKDSPPFVYDKKDKEASNEFGIDSAKIKGFLYVSQLFGEPKITEGQRFRVRETGEIMAMDYQPDSEVLLLDYDKVNNTYKNYYKSELEPVFE
jgi:hypothetical protein